MNAFTGYGEGYVLVNGARHSENVIVLPERVLPWSATGFDTLQAQDFAELAAMPLEVVLLGTGDAAALSASAPYAIARRRAHRTGSHGCAGRVPHLQYPDGRVAQGRRCPVVRLTGDESI